MNTEIKFVTSETREKNARGETRYQAQLRHNAVLGEKETKQAFAVYAGKHLSDAAYYVDALAEFIAKSVEEGLRLDFGGFSVGLKIRKGLKSANAPFDPDVNSVNVEMTPGRAIREAARTLRPVNVTDRTKWTIDSNCQQKPFEAYDCIATDGERTLSAVGCYPQINVGAADEGIWLEDDEGVRLLAGEVVRSGFGVTSYRLSGPIKRGYYWLVIQSRDDASTLVRVRRRISVMCAASRTKLGFQK